jgi:hypothetical protein
MPQMDNTWRLEASLFCGTETFRNTMDIRWASGGTPVAPNGTEGIVTAYAAMLRAIYFPDVTLNNIVGRGIWYKQGPPPHPEHPPLFDVFIGGAGNGNTTFGGAHNSNYLPQQVCVFSKKTTTGGRAGKLFWRNVLTEVDVQSTIGGVWAFSPGAGHFDPAVFDSAVQAAISGFTTFPPASGDYNFAVTHLENIKDADVRTPYSTIMQSLTAVRPTWNSTSR